MPIIILTLISGCSFINISCAGKNNAAYGRCDSSVIRDSLASNGVMGISGEIVSGIAHDNNGRGYSFISSNNSFVECLRSKISYHMEMNEDYKDTNYTSQISLSNASSHTITNCTFTNCFIH